MRLTVRDIVQNINLLDTNQDYNYIKSSTKGKIRIISVALPEGPIAIKRYNPTQGETLGDKKVESISVNMIRRIANAFAPHRPINFDRVVGCSYNTRSVLEALLAATPNIYYCYPGRLEYNSFGSSIEEGHKHLVWFPDERHKPGELVLKTLKGIVISELATEEIIYENLEVPESLAAFYHDSSNDTIRIHLQMQINVIIIGHHMKYKTWIAQNDRGAIYRGKKLSELEDVIDTLDSQRLMRAFPDASSAARLIDAIWFKHDGSIPALMEVEHTTGVVSGLTRMNGFRERLDYIITRYVIIAPDEDRDKVVFQANQPQFKKLNARFLPYSGLEELRWLCEKRKINGMDDSFLDYYFDKIVTE